jgi:hypothetical protein
MMMASYSGGCVCGAVRYKANDEPAFAFHCQCRDCQRWTGTGHVSALLFPAAAVQLSGEIAYHAKPADSGNIMRRGFCPTCGACVVGRPEAMPDLIGVTAGSLDDPSRFAPQFVFYTRSAQPWDRVDPALAHFETVPSQ